MEANVIRQVISEGSTISARVGTRFASCMEIKLQDLWYV